MQIDRRAFLAQGFATGVLLGFPGLLHAQMTLGDMTLDVVSDGHLTLPGSFAFNDMPKDLLMPILERMNQPFDQLTPPCNLSLLRGNGRVVLFDAGSGTEFMPTAGKSPTWFSPMVTLITFGVCWTISGTRCSRTLCIIWAKPNGITGPTRIPSAQLEARGRLSPLGPNAGFRS